MGEIALRVGEGHDCDNSPGDNLGRRVVEHGRTLNAALAV